MCDRSGATAVEFALVLFPLLILMFGSIEVARVLWVQQALNKTAISAARCVGIRSSDCAEFGVFRRDLATAFIQREGRSWGVPLAEAAITIMDNGDCDGATGYSSIVLATEIFSPAPFIVRMLSGSPQMTAKACFPAERAGL